MTDVANSGGNGNSQKINSGWKLERLERLRRCKEMKRADMHVAQVLSEAWDSKSGFVRMSYPKIAEKSRYSERSVQYSVKRLLQHGFLELRTRGDSSGNCNEYYLRMPSANVVQKLHGGGAKTDANVVQPVAHLPAEGSPTDLSLTESPNMEEKRVGRAKRDRRRVRSPAFSISVTGYSRDTRTTPLGYFPVSVRFVPRAKSSSWSRRPSVPAAMLKES